MAMSNHTRTVRQRYSKAKTAKKAGKEAGISGAGAIIISLVLRWFWKIDLTTEEITGLTAGIAGISAALRYLVDWWKHRDD